MMEVFGARLPFPVIAIEYIVTKDHPARVGADGEDKLAKELGFTQPDIVPAPKRLLLAFEPDSSSERLYRGDLADPVAFYIYEIHFSHDQKMWIPTPAMMAMRPDGHWNLLFITRSIAAAFNEDSANHLILDYASEGPVVVEMLAALSCKNVELNDLPAPEKINKARRLRGKAPFFSYKELVVSADAASTSGSSAVGTHASPRAHLRRGHIRRLPKGNVWVNACVVGSLSDGVALKDYRVDSSSPAGE